jgi:ABC-type branched-subunit amino acid transport system substrate-binding protein
MRPMCRQASRRVAAPMLVACLLVSAALFAAACGNDEEGGSADVAKTTNVGVLLPLTGELASFAKPWQQVVEMAVDEANSSGGLPGGTKLELQIEDYKFDAETAVELVRKMVSTADVKAISGPGSESMVALAPVAQRSRVPVVSASAGTLSLNKFAGKFIYRTVADDNADGPIIARVLKDRGAKKPAFLMENDASPISVMTVAKRVWEEQGGTVVAEAKLTANQSSYRAEIGSVMSKDPDMIVCACSPATATTALKGLNAAGYKGMRLVTADALNPEVIKAVGPKAIEGTFGQTISSDTEGPAYKAFMTKLKERFDVDEAYPYAPNTYDSMAVLIIAMMAAGSTDGQDIDKKIADVSAPPGKKVYTIEEAAKALKAGEDVDYDGPSGPLDFVKGTAQTPYSIQQVVDGKWKQVDFYPGGSGE